MKLSYRKLENIHILFWLIKDLCWMMQFKVLGVLMVIPTVLMAIWITWHTKNNKLMVWPNLAVLCWISANATWMLDEFFEWGVKTVALSFFCLGLIFIIRYIYTILTPANSSVRK